MTFEELSGRLDGTRSVLVGRAYQKPSARLVARLKTSDGGTELRCMDFDGALLETVWAPNNGPRFSIDSFQSMLNGTPAWPALLGPDELRRLVLLYHGPDISTKSWLETKVPHKLSNHPVIPSVSCCEILDGLTQKIGELSERSAEGDAKMVNCNALLKAALLARLFSEAALLSIGMPKDDRLYELMLRSPELLDENLSGWFMDGLVEAHLTGKIKPSQLEQKAATEGHGGV